MANYFLVIISAFLFSTAFLFPAHCFWTIFIFYAPLYKLFIQGKSTFWLGLFWGIITWSLQLLALLLFLFEHGTCSKRGGFVAWLLLILYLSLYAGFWFWLLRISHQFCFNKIMKLLSISCISLFYFWFINRAVFFIFGRIFGYPFSNPLLPLFVTISLFTNRIPEAGWQDFVATVTPSNSMSAWERAYEFLEASKNVIAEKPNTKVIITPESAFPFALNHYPEFVALWTEYPGLENLHFLIGAHRQEGEKLFNTLYHIHQGRIIQYYDKITTLLIAEELPKNKWWRWTKGLFLKNKKEISAGANERLTICVDTLPAILPYICSDLFFSYESPKRDDSIILCIVNDGWFKMNYMKKLMALYIQFQSYLWHKKIFYVSY